MQSQLRALGRSSPFHFTRPPRQVQNTHHLPPCPPREGCSRWFSCSHCHASPASTGQSFFPATFDTPLSGRASEEHLSRPEATPRAKPRPRLPLPPTLPYSPDSVPFQRHLELLQFSLSSDPETSWATYSAIHSTLKRFVPNGLYRGLLAHQLDDPAVPWERVEELVRFAEDCGMRLDLLGVHVVENALRLGVSAGIDDIKHGKDIDFGPILDLWNTNVRLVHGNVGNIPAPTRRGWLQLLHDRALQQTRIPARKQILEIAFETLSQFVKAGATENIGEVAGTILSMKIGHMTVDDTLHRLQLLGWCLSSGLKVEPRDIRRVVGRARQAFKSHGADQNQRLSQAVQAICRNLDGPLLQEAVAILSSTAEWSIQVNTTRRGTLESGRQLVKQSNLSIPGIIREAIRLLRRIPTPSDHRKVSPDGIQIPPAEAISVALLLFERVAHRPFAESHALVAIISHRLIVLQTSPEIMIPSVVRFANTLFSAGLFPHVDDRLVNMIFYLLVVASKTSEEAYSLARRVYALARATEKPHVWTMDRVSQRMWKSLLRRALLHRPQRHVHFASRLYADRLADGIPVDKEDALFFIRMIGRVGSSTKYILLERHLKDYQYFGYGSSTDDFVLALVEGLTVRRQPREAWFGFHLMMRIIGEKPIPEQALCRVIGVLSNSRRVINHRRCIEVLRHVPDSYPILGELYEESLKQLVRRGIDPKRDKSKEAAVAVAVEALKEMLSRGLQPSDQAETDLVILLNRGGFAWHASKIILSRLERNHVVTTESIVDTMVSAIKSGDYTTAMDLEQGATKYRGDEARRDRRIQGARAYMELKRGLAPVDIAGFHVPEVLEKAKRMVDRDKEEEIRCANQEKDAAKAVGEDSDVSSAASRLVQRMNQARGQQPVAIDLELEGKAVGQV